MCAKNKNENEIKKEKKINRQDTLHIYGSQVHSRVWPFKNVKTYCTVQLCHRHVKFGIELKKKKNHVSMNMKPIKFIILVFSFFFMLIKIDK